MLKGFIFRRMARPSCLFTFEDLDFDLSAAKGLETVVHHGPSTIGIDTIYKSRSKIPEVFLREWECFDADTGKDSANEIRQYFIPDFGNWNEHDSYRVASISSSRT